MNWDDPLERLRLIERVGATAYNRALTEHLEKGTVSVVNGRGIRRVVTRFGTLFAIDRTKLAFSTQQQAEDHARTLPYEEPR